jgi:hypothetical protein
MKRLMVCVVVVLLAVGATGCSAISNKIGEEVGEGIAGGIMGGDVEVDGDNVTIKTDDGELSVSGNEAKLPDDFPKDFPIYDDAEVESASSIASGGSKTFYVNFESTDEPQAVYDRYKAEGPSEGWTLESDYFMSSSDGDSGIISLKKDKMTASVAIGASDSGTAITLGLTIEG